MLEHALADIVALGCFGQMQEQGAHLGLFERAEIVDLEVIVERCTVILRRRWRARTCSDKNGRARSHE